MTGQSELSLLAEVSIGLAGFSGVVFAIRGSDDAHALARFRALLLLVTSFHALFLALIPLVVHAFGVEGPQLWRLSAAVCLLVTLPSPLAVLRVRPQGYASSAYYRSNSIISLTLAIPAYGALIINALALGTEGSFAFHLLSVVLTIATAVPSFVVVLLAPSHE